MSYVAIKIKKGLNQASFNTSNQFVITNGTTSTTIDPTATGPTGNGTDPLAIDGNGKAIAFNPDSNIAKALVKLGVTSIHGANACNYWPFCNDNGTDFGNVNALTLVANAAPTYGDVGNVRYIDFNGSTQYLSGANVVGSSAGQNVRFNDSFSLSCWVNPDVANVFQTLIGKANNNVSTPSSSTHAYLLYFQNNAYLSFRIYDDSETNDDNVITYIGRDVASVAVVGTWKHIVAVYDSAGGDIAAKVKVYINGVVQAGSDASAGSTFVQVEDVATDFTVGANVNVSTLASKLDGKMALIRAVPLALSATQAKQIYDYERELMGL